LWLVVVFVDIVEEVPIAGLVVVVDVVEDVLLDAGVS